MSPQQGHRRSGLRLAGAFHITATLDRLADLPRDVIEKDFSAARGLRPTELSPETRLGPARYCKSLRRRNGDLSTLQSSARLVAHGQAISPARVESLRELLTAESLRSPFCCNLVSGRSVNLECTNVRFALKQVPQ